MEIVAEKGNIDGGGHEDDAEVGPMLEHVPVLDNAEVEVAMQVYSLTPMNCTLLPE
jgi:hypothetical protein